MLLIPAIDLKDGQCVRLRQGRMEDLTVFSDDPRSMARHWRKQGCRRLHVVDLDGAFAGEPKNSEVVEAIVEGIGDVPVQLGGGIRTEETIDTYMRAGVSQVILGTAALQEPDFLAAAVAKYPGKVILGLDARDGLVATWGWDRTSKVSAVQFARQVASLDIAAIVYTDISRDGMMQGLNVEATLALAEAVDIPVIASGGVSTLEDLQRLSDAAQQRGSELMGAITGRAIYAGTLDFRAGQNLLDQASATAH
ncbi:MAG: 1-(5-phosphoribosyl)-5-[(5-phosphoribosylamino)methylideneamino]imidazole-4-carboxamide isomerase [Gammaproteobacteria bacterium]|nr:1-(5-phosphoribosyl)-5-[(5-phosphoribosylamino)methylideneamino]imidazole-4-carboxamide isomerase [Gammaproteobacteria bacterium]